MSKQSTTQPVQTTLDFSALSPLRVIDQYDNRITTNTRKAHETRKPFTGDASKFLKSFHKYINCDELESLQVKRMKFRHGYPIKVDTACGISSTGHIVVYAAGFKKCLVHYSQITTQKIERANFTNQRAR